MGKLSYSCVFVPSWAAGIKGTGGQTPVMWSAASHGGSECEGGFFLPQTELDNLRHHVALIRARPARYMHLHSPSLHTHANTHTLHVFNPSFNSLISHPDVDNSSKLLPRAHERDDMLFICVVLVRHDALPN